jgi:hypothetical protein
LLCGSPGAAGSGAGAGDVVGRPRWLGRRLGSSGATRKNRGAKGPGLLELQENPPQSGPLTHLRLRRLQNRIRLPDFFGSG